MSQISEDSSDGPDTPSTGESDAISVSRQYRSLTDIYENTEEVELDEELLFLGIEKPATYNQAAKERAWKDAMQCEIDAIERNHTWNS